MGRNRVLETRGSPFYVDGKLLEGVTNVTVPGATAQRFAIGDVLDTTRKYAVDIPDPGSASVVFYFNPGDDLHSELVDFQEDATLVKCEWYVDGKKVNGVKTKTAETIGTVSVSSLAPITGALKTADVVFGTYSNDEPAIGDYLIPSSGDNLVVTGMNYTTADNIKLRVKTTGTSNISATSTAKTYTIKKPAKIVEFTGQITGLPMSGQQVVTATMAISITGNVTYRVGSPDIT